MFTRIYALAVCFASVLCIAISTGIGIYDVVQISFPEQTMDSYQYRSYQSNDVFLQSQPYPHAMMINPMMSKQAIATRGRGTAPAIQASAGLQESQQEITKRREKQLATAVNNVVHDAQNSLIQILIILFISIPLFIIHWRFAQKLDNHNAAS
jgi:hypothetical protein